MADTPRVIQRAASNRQHHTDSDNTGGSTRWFGTRLCLLVIIGVRADGRKELLAARSHRS
jgi:hypothetical protein